MFFCPRHCQEDTLELSCRRPTPKPPFVWQPSQEYDARWLWWKTPNKTWKMDDWLVVWNMNGLWFSIYWECHHPNWREFIFFRGVETWTWDSQKTIREKLLALLYRKQMRLEGNRLEVLVFGFVHHCLLLGSSTRRWMAAIAWFACGKMSLWLFLLCRIIS